jgi:hypothetical protein
MIVFAMAAFYPADLPDCNQPGLELPSTPMSEVPCELCQNSHPNDGDLCPSLREAAAAGAHPRGVPLRVYGGYLEARAALRANAPAAAIRVLQWLLDHLAEERGIAADRSFAAKLDELCAREVISPRVRNALFPSALAADAGPERAWALMSIVEHAFHRLYLSKSGVASASA